MTLKKSGFISFCGWAFLALVVFGFGDALIGGFTIPHNPPFSGAVAAGALLLAVPCFLLWALGSIIHRFRVSGAKIRAQAMVEAQQNTGLGAVPAVQPGGKCAPVPTGLNLCGVCNREPAYVRCVEHGVLLCQQCWPVHNWQQHSGAAPAAQTGAN